MLAILMGRADVWLDGTLTRWDDARASVLCHGMQRGALVFDVGRLRYRPNGTRLLFRPREHIARFLRSAGLIGLTVPWDEASLLDATLHVVRTMHVVRSVSPVDSHSPGGWQGPHGARGALVRWSAFVPSLEADVVPHPGARASVAVAVVEPEDSAPPLVPPASPGSSEPMGRKPATVRVWVPSDLRKAGPEVFPPQAKVSASYLGPMLAKRRALAEGFDEVVLLDREGRAAEAPTANVFVAKDGTLTTPPVERVLAGITRDSVLAVARAEGIPVAEAHLSLRDLENADEAFLTATSLPVQAIACFGNRTLPAGAPGPITARIRDLIMACEMGLDTRFADWTVEVS
jgi:branched-chain amino acid aminotransferase